MHSNRARAICAVLAVCGGAALGWQGPEERPQRKRRRGPDRAILAMQQRRMQLEDEHGRIPPGALLSARRHVDAMRGPPAGAEERISRTGWRWLGPGNIGGRVRSLLIHPTRPSVLYTASVSGGIWKSEDAGSSWRPLDDFMPNLVVSTMAMHPQDPDVLYAGTGEGLYMSAGLDGAGIFKSADAGRTWTQLPGTAPASFPTMTNRIALSPGDGRVMLAATNTGLLRSADDGATFRMVNANGMLDVDFHPADGNLAIAGTFGSAFHSSDGGQSWRTATGITSDARGSGRVELAYSRSNPEVVYASVDYAGGQLYRSDDGGLTYRQTSTGTDYLREQGDYDNLVWVSPTDPQVVVVGGINVWRSTDGGATLVEVSDWSSAPFSAHADQHVMVAHPGFDGSTNLVAYLGNDGGVYRTDNVLTVNDRFGWIELNNGLGITQFYGAGVNPTTGVVVGGTQDNGTLRYEGDPEGWTETYGGDGGFSASDPTDPNVFYGEYVFLALFRTSDLGRSAEMINGETGGGWKPPPYTIEDAQTESALFIAPFTLDPSDANRLYAGGVSLWRTNDAKAPLTDTTGPSWARVRSPSADGAISTIAVAPGNPNVVWVGYPNGALYKTEDALADAPTWSTHLGSAEMPARYASDITIDRRDPNLVYAVFGGFAPDNVWRTRDGGRTWEALSGEGAGALPAVPVRSLVVSPNNPRWLYIGTELGAFASQDGGAHWNVPDEGPSHVPVDELVFARATLYAVTHGRGVFAHDTCPAGMACDDGDACTTGETCDAEGACVGGAALSCDDGDACTMDRCDATMGCVREAVACDDGDQCTDDSCDPASGCAHASNASRCDDRNPCTDDRCDATMGCVSAPNTASCDDGDECTTADRCSAGRCRGRRDPACEEPAEEEGAVKSDGGCSHRPGAPGGQCGALALALLVLLLRRKPCWR